VRAFSGVGLPDGCGAVVACSGDELPVGAEGDFCDGGVVFEGVGGFSGFGVPGFGGVVCACSGQECAVGAESQVSHRGIMLKSVDKLKCLGDFSGEGGFPGR